MKEKDTCIQDMTKAIQWSCTDVEAYLSPLSYEALLDVGCGTDCLLAQLPPSNTRVHWEIDLSQRLPFEDNTFDVVTCIHSFHQCPNPDKAMREILRVLKPGGRYLLSDQRDGVASLWRSRRRENRHSIRGYMERNGFINVVGTQVRGRVYTVIGRKPRG